MRMCTRHYGLVKLAIIYFIFHLPIKILNFCGALKDFYSTNRLHQQIFLQEQQELVSQLENQEVDVAGDGRFDSPGFSAKFLTYSVYVEQINKILHSVQIQLGEVSNCHIYTNSSLLCHATALSLRTHSRSWGVGEKPSESGVSMVSC